MVGNVATVGNAGVDGVDGVEGVAAMLGISTFMGKSANLFFSLTCGSESAIGPMNFELQLRSKAILTQKAKYSRCSTVPALALPCSSTSFIWSESNAGATPGGSLKFHNVLPIDPIPPSIQRVCPGL